MASMKEKRVALLMERIEILSLLKSSYYGLIFV